MKVALYARVSTAEAKEQQNPENQLIRLRDYCRFRQWDIVKEYHEYRSGLDDDRPVLKTMLEDAMKGDFDYILVFKLDRLTRSPSKLVDIMDRLKDPATGKYLVHLVSANEGLDTSNRYAEGMLIMLGVVAGWEAEGFAERRTAGIERAKRFGTKSGKPFGRPKAHVPRKAIEAVQAGMSLRKASKEFGVPLATLSRRFKNIPRSALNTDPPREGEIQNEVDLEHGGERGSE